MSEPEQERRGGTPADTPEIRRLRVVSAFTDPFLVTKLPQETSVVSGVIRLGERTVLGFLHQPFPDGTKVRVVYREWLLAERIEESGSEPAEPSAEAREGRSSEVEPEVRPDASEDAVASAAKAVPQEEAVPQEQRAAAEPKGEPAEVQKAEVEPEGKPNAVERGRKLDAVEPEGKPAEVESEEKRDSAEPAEAGDAGPAEEATSRSEPTPERKRVEQPKDSPRRSSGPDDAGARNVFPEDLTGIDDADAASAKEDDPWTDAFRRRGKRRSGED